MHVVVVDPSRTVLKCVARLLEARQDAVHTFTDGGKAFEFINSDLTVDALITSTEPLSMSGLELCARTRELASQRPIFVLLMSSNFDDAKMIEALDSGADDFVIKPPAVERLYARLRAAERMTSMQRELIRLATTDALTGVLNRRAFFERAKTLCARAEAGVALSAIMVDIDHFKRINDLRGHDTGDEAIRLVAREIAIKDSLCVRLGGEEFAILIEGCVIVEAAEIAETLRVALAASQVGTGESAVRLSCSFGVSGWQRGDTIDRLLKRADVALYDAKLGGRNRVVVADTAMSTMDFRDMAGVLRSTMQRVG